MTKTVMEFDEFTNKLHERGVPFLAWMVDDDKGSMDLQLTPYHLKFFLRHLLTARPETVPMISIVLLENQVADILRERGDTSPENNGLVV